MTQCNGDCPTKESWQQWLQGESMADEVKDSMQRQLDRCHRCREMVESLSETDPFFYESREALSGLATRDRELRAGPSDLAVEDRIEASESESQKDSALLSIVSSLLGPTDDETAIGSIGRFAVTGIIGSGGMGIVLKARSLDVDRVVAIKIPQPQHWQATGTLLTIEREARSAAAVVHPNVISIYHVDRYRDVPYLVMPYLSGESLEQRLRRLSSSHDHTSRTLDTPSTLRILRQVAAALKAAHSCGVIHRDVKPANILLVGGTERAVLSDFGLAKIQSEATCTATGTFAGTPIYLSPEQASGGVAGPAADIFCLGTVLWTMLAGEPPFVGMHTHAIIHRIARGEIPELPQTLTPTPPYLRRLLQRLHASDPALRPDAETLLEWIEQCERHVTHPDEQPLPPTLSAEHASRRDLSSPGFVLTSIVICLLFAFSLTRGCPFDLSRYSTDVDGPTPSQVRSVDDETPSASAIELEIPTEALINEVELLQIQKELDQLNRESLPAWEKQIRALEEKP